MIATQEHIEKARQKRRRHGSKAEWVVRNLESSAFGRGNEEKALFWQTVGEILRNGEA